MDNKYAGSYFLKMYSNRAVNIAPVPAVDINITVNQ